MGSDRKYAAILILIIVGLFGKCVYDVRYNDIRYEDALALIAEERYEEAHDKLKRVLRENYLDTEPLLAYCEGNIAYESGDIEAAYKSCYSFRFENQTPEQQEIIDVFRDKVEWEYDEKYRQEEIEEQKAYERRIAVSQPFVGMSEEYISKTSLGNPYSKIRHSTEYINGERYTSNIYDFHRGERVFTAKCVRGVVTEIINWRKEGASLGGTTYTSKGSNSKSDPYEASEYIHPDDFYYDHYDDFEGYEDAEDYWNEYAD